MTRAHLIAAVAVAVAAVGCGGASAGERPGTPPGASSPTSDARPIAASPALSPAAAAAVANDDGPGEVERFAIPTAGAATRGAAEPLVTLVQFGDYECPFTVRAQPTVEALLKRYPDELRVVYRHYPLPFHEGAVPAVHAAEEVRRQGGDAAFWQYHERLLAEANVLDDGTLVALAEGIDGVDVEALRAAIDAAAHEARLAEDGALVERFAVAGTPFHFLNGRPLAGAQPFDVFDRIVREEIVVASRLSSLGVARSDLPRVLLETAQPRRDPPAPEPVAERRPDDAAVYDVPLTGGEPVLGPRDALVTIVVVSDFQCPFCARVQPTLATLRERYGEDVRFVWMNYPLPFHENARPAAIAAHEVFRRGGDDAFWRYHDRLFERQEALSADNLAAWAGELGVDPDHVRRAIADETHAELLRAQEALVVSRGARGTPSFFLNGRLVRGAQPLSVFARVIDEELARARALLDSGVRRRGLYAAAIADGATEPVFLEGAAPEPPMVRVVIPVPSDAPARGPANAPLTVQMFVDFECPFCRRVQPTLERLMRSYPRRVRWVLRHHPLPFHHRARLAHRAALEVLAQGGVEAFWRYHDRLFAAGDALSRGDLERYASELGGIDLPAFSRALDEGRHDARVQRDIDAVADAGARIGTPSFLLGDRLIQGAHPYETFRDAIEAELAALASDGRSSPVPGSHFRPAALGPPGDEHDVLPAAVPAGAEHAAGRRVEAPASEAREVAGVVGERPDRERAPGAERAPRPVDAGVAVEAPVAAVGDGDGAVVDVEEDGVVAARGPLPEPVDDVAGDEDRSRVPERVAREGAEGALVPRDDAGDELGDLDDGAGADPVEGLPEREAHAEAADEDPRVRRGAGEAELGEGAGRGRVFAGHQLDAPRPDAVLRAAAAQLEDHAVRRVGGAESFPREHRRPLGTSAPAGDRGGPRAAWCRRGARRAG